MMSVESLEIASVVDRFPKEVRARLREAVWRIADVYRQTMQTMPLAAMREEHRAAHPKESGEPDEPGVASVIYLSSRR